MSEKAIIVSEISKSFDLGKGKSGSIRDAFTNAFYRKNESRIFNALENVSFSVDFGDTIGIVGRNGAGKSTLLKILSRITYPTKGKFELFGRVGSLLEVGTGFHSELTGRENIYLNGTILGMTRNEVKAKFDEIVSFSGVEKFLDTPVKKYSSGMTVRLAFSVAAHLDPEILIVDEVLAVGDAEFQKKCLGKMREVSATQGKTVLFVSHNLGAVSQLCSKGILLDKGKLLMTGSSSEVINKYLDFNRQCTSMKDRRDDSGWEKRNHFVFFGMNSRNGKSVSEFLHDEIIEIEIKIHVPEMHVSLELALSLYDQFKNRIFTIHENIGKLKFEDNLLIAIIQIHKHFLAPGNYSWIMCLNHPGVEIQDLQDDFYSFTVIDNGSEFYKYPPGSFGSVFPSYTLLK